MSRHNMERVIRAARELVKAMDATGCTSRLTISVADTSWKSCLKGVAALTQINAGLNVDLTKTDTISVGDGITFQRWALSPDPAPHIAVRDRVLREIGRKADAEHARWRREAGLPPLNPRNRGI